MIFFMRQRKAINGKNQTTPPFIRIYRYIGITHGDIIAQPILVSPDIVEALDVRELNTLSIYPYYGKFSRLKDWGFGKFKSPISPDMCRVGGEERTIFSLISSEFSLVPNKRASSGLYHSKRVYYSAIDRRRQAVRILHTLRNLPGFTLSEKSKEFLNSRPIFGQNLWLEFWLADDCTESELSDRLFYALAQVDCRKDIFEVLSKEYKILACLFLHRNTNSDITPCYDIETLREELKNNFQTVKKELNGDAWILAFSLFGHELYEIDPEHFERQLRQFFIRKAKTNSIFTNDQWVELASQLHDLYPEQTEEALSRGICKKNLLLYKKLEFLTSEKRFALFPNPEYLTTFMDKEEFLELAEEKLSGKSDKAKFRVLECLEAFGVSINKLLNRQKLSELIVSAGSHAQNPDILNLLIKHEQFIDVWLTLIANKRCPQYARYITIDGFSITPEKMEQFFQNTNFCAQDIVYQLQVLLKLQEYLLPSFHGVLKEKIAACTPQDLAQAGRNGSEDIARVSHDFPDAAHNCFYFFLISGEYENASTMLAKGFTPNCDTLKENAFKLSSEERVRAEETINRLFRESNISEPRKKEMMRQIKQQSSGYVQQPASPETATHRFWSPANSFPSNSEQSSLGFESGVGL